MLCTAQLSSVLRRLCAAASFCRQMSHVFCVLESRFRNMYKDTHVSILCIVHICSNRIIFKHHAIKLHSKGCYGNQSISLESPNYPHISTNREMKLTKYLLWLHESCCSLSCLCWTDSNCRLLAFARASCSSLSYLS